MVEPRRRRTGHQPRPPHHKHAVTVTTLRKGRSGRSPTVLEDEAAGVQGTVRQREAGEFGAGAETTMFQLSTSKPGPKRNSTRCATGSRALLGNPPTRSSASPSLIAEPKVRGENRTARVSRLIDFRDVLASVSEPHKCRRLRSAAALAKSSLHQSFPFWAEFPKFRQFVVTVSFPPRTR